MSGGAAVRGGARSRPGRISRAAFLTQLRHVARQSSLTPRWPGTECQWSANFSASTAASAGVSLFEVALDHREKRYRNYGISANVVGIRSASENEEQEQNEVFSNQPASSGSSELAIVTAHQPLPLPYTKDTGMRVSWVILAVGKLSDFAIAAFAVSTSKASIVAESLSVSTSSIWTSANA